MTPTVISYLTRDGKLVRDDLSACCASLIAPATSFGWNPADPNEVAYLNGAELHLWIRGLDRVLTTLPPVPGRGVNSDEDDTFLRFSADGQYFALFQTLATGGSGETAPDQIRRAADGSLVYSTSGMTMAVWASQPSRLYYRDTNGEMFRWDASTGVSHLMHLNWIHPRPSPDGRWIAYGFRSPGGDGVGFYSVQSNSVANTSPPGRFGPVFLNNSIVWYFGEKPCDTCFGGLPQATGQTYLYDLSNSTETSSRLASVFDAWPKTP